MVDTAVALVRPWLDEAGQALGSVPTWLYLLGHSAFCATLADDLKDRYLLHYWLTFAAGFGGGAFSAFLFMRPDEVSINYFASNIDIIWTLTWWAINYFPYNIPGRIQKLMPVRMATKVCLNVLRTRTLCARVTQCTKYYPAAMFAPIVMGTIGGSGGKVVSEMIRGGYGITTGRDEMSLPTFSVQSGVVCSVLYYWLVHISALLTAAQGTTLITLLLIFHGLVVDLTGTAFNFAAPLYTIFHTLSNIPQPLPVGTVQPSKKAKNKLEEDKKKD